MSEQVASFLEYVATMVVIVWVGAGIGSSIDDLTKAVRESKDGE